VSTGNSRVSDVPVSAIELEIALGAVVSSLDFQAARTYVIPLVVKKFARSFIEEVDSGRKNPRNYGVFRILGSDSGF
jgi:hypothetical protein